MGSFSRAVFVHIAIIMTASLMLSACRFPWQKEAPAGLQVTTQQTSASVFLNGEFVNKTPYVDKTLKPGKYTVRLEPQDPNLASYETTVNLASNTLSVLNWKFGELPDTSGGVLYEMEPVSGKPVLSIVSIPDGGIVRVDDASQGFTPVLQNDITAGVHTFQVSLPSFEEQKQSVNIVDGYRMNVTVKLAREAVQTEEATSSAQTETEQASSSAATKEVDESEEEDSKTASTSASTPAKPYVKILSTPTGFLRVREKADQTSKELVQVKPGEMFKFIETSDNNWHQIEYEKGKQGWVSGQYAQVVK